MSLKNSIKKVIPQKITNCETYKFISFLWGYYKKHCQEIYEPEDFALCENGVVVEPGVKINMPKRMVLKEYAVIHKGTIINSNGGFYLGRYSGISYNCTIFTGDHQILKSTTIPFDKRSLLKPVFIDDFVMIGVNVSIKGGVRIGEGAVIGMGSVVTQDIPPLAIVMGNPAKPIAYRDRDHFQRLKKKNAFQCTYGIEYEEIMLEIYRRKYKDFLDLINLPESC